MADLQEKYDKNIRPLLDAVDRLRNLKVTSEGIPLPSIVVVGDQSSGKSSVLESLAAISLPRGQGIATRVPLILRLQSCRPEESSITISYKDVEGYAIQEDGIEAAVNCATIALAGNGKGVTDTPISLHIRKPNAPDLTMIDLPGITRVPVHGQPENIYEQISAMIRHYLKPEETVILNVLSATVDFSTCESIRMSQNEDKRGQRTLAVVTKVDRSPEGVFEKVVADDVNIGLGYICVRNRTDDDVSHKEAREKERLLFETHPSLSQLDKNAVGIASLAERLTQIQGDIIRQSLPDIGKQIDKALRERLRELETLTRNVPAGETPTDAFLNIVEENKNLMQDLVLDGLYGRYAEVDEMHYPARIDEAFHRFSNELHDPLKNILLPSKTEDIVKQGAEMKGVCLPNFLSPVLMKSLVGQEIDQISNSCTRLVNQTHDYAISFLIRIIESSTSGISKFASGVQEGKQMNMDVVHQFISRSQFENVLQNVVAACRAKCMTFINRVLEKERSSVFTVNDYYMANVRKIQSHAKTLKTTEDVNAYGSIKVEGFEELIDLTESQNMTNEFQAAWDMKINLAAYWKVVHKRMADEICLELRYSLECAIVKDLRHQILRVAQAGADVANYLMEEHANTVKKKAALKKRIAMLMECKAVVENFS